MLKIPESLRYFGDSSRVEISGMVAAVLRESSHPDALQTRLFAGGCVGQYRSCGFLTQAGRLPSRGTFTSGRNRDREVLV
jgi:hypothetical protein